MWKSTNVIHFIISNDTRVKKVKTTDNIKPHKYKPTTYKLKF